MRVVYNDDAIKRPDPKVIYNINYIAPHLSVHEWIVWFNDVITDDLI